MAYRSSAPDLAERPGDHDRDRTGRWDRDRFSFERDRDRYGDIRERFEEDDDHVYTRREPNIPPRAPPPPRERSVPRYSSGARGPGGAYEEDDVLIRERRRVFEDDRLPIRRRPSPPPTRFRSPSPPRRGPLPGGRPGAPLRRPSSLDTFERREKERELAYRDREREYSPAPRRGDFRAPPYMDIPLPRHKALPPPRFREREQEYYDEIRVSDPDRFGDDDFHKSERVVREKKMVRTRRRSRSRESRTTRSFRSSSRSTSSSSSSSATSTTTSRTGTTVTVKSGYPKKGKTRIPARLVSRRALIDLEYPFVEEGNTIVIQKALGQQNIDDLLKLSDDYKKSEHELELARSLPGDIIEERRTTEVILPASGHHHVSFEDTAPGQGGAPLVVSTNRPITPIEVQQKTTAIIRDVSPSRSYTTSSYTSGTGTTSDTYSTTSYDSSLTAVPVYHHHHHPSTMPVREIREVSTEVPIGPVAIIDHRRGHSHHRHGSRHSHSRSRSRHTRHSSLGGGELVRAERLPTGELVLLEETIEHVEEPSRGVRIEKDRRGPPPSLMKAMLATLT